VVVVVLVVVVFLRNKKYHTSKPMAIMIKVFFMAF
jgi:hypothetical protein